MACILVCEALQAMRQLFFVRQMPKASLVHLAQYLNPQAPDIVIIDEVGSLAASTAYPVPAASFLGNSLP
jgi:hypothetical protein